MKEVKQFKLGKNHIAIVSLSALLVLVIVAYVVMNAILSGTSGKGSDSSETPGEMISIREELGESSYAGYPVAYSRIKPAEMMAILVENFTGSTKESSMKRYSFVRESESSSFLISYYDPSSGKDVTYTPDFFKSHGDFASYDDLYATVNESGMAEGPLLTYLCVAIGTMYFTERIDLPTVPEGATEAEKDEILAERNEILRDFGFAPEDEMLNQNQAAVTFTYVDSSGSEDEKDGDKENSLAHSIVIGGQPVSKLGYYYRVDGRDCIYYSGTDYLKYALYSVESFVKGTLVSAGLDMDGAYEPYLTTDFKQWKSEKFDTVGDVITENAVVVANGVGISPRDPELGYMLPEGATNDYYEYSPPDIIDFDFHDALVYSSDYKRMMAMLTGKSVGDYENLYVSHITPLGSFDAKRVDLSEKSEVTYTYVITGVEAIITETDEVVSEEQRAALLAESGGTLEYNLIKISYEYEIDGARKSGGTNHAILDLTSPLLDSETVNILRSTPIGASGAEICRFDVTYTAANTLKGINRLVISSISAITDSDGMAEETVAKDSFVTFNYYEIVDGVTQPTKTWTVRMTDYAPDADGKNADPYFEGIYSALIGKTRNASFNYNLWTRSYHQEIMRHFTTYKINTIKYFVQYNPVVSFRFVNASDRDPFFGESFYENTLVGAYALYGLNASACEHVVNFLGGVGDDGTTVSAGFYGETVALGLTTEAMDYYELNAHRIYFELPRVIVDPGDTGEDDLSNYTWYGTLGFNLYISEVKYNTDGSTYRYIGSDMYDLVAKVPAEDFGFLDYDFSDFWARKYLLLMDIDNIDTVTLDFKMEDVYGEYEFDIDEKNYYLGQISGGEYIYSENKASLENQGITDITQIKAHRVNVTPTGSITSLMDTELKHLMVENKYREISMGELYNTYYDYPSDYYVAGTLDTVGDDNFKIAFSVLQSTRYHSDLTEEEKNLVFGEDSTLSPVMTMKVKLVGGEGFYMYDFYRITDRKVMVVQYRTTASGHRVDGTTVGDFYVTSFAFKQIVDKIVGLLNCEKIDTDTDYPGVWK